MSFAAQMANELKRGLPDEYHGLTDISVYNGMKIPDEYEFTEVLGDIILAEYVDCSQDGQLIERDGIFVSNDVTKNTWRVAKVLLHGKGCSDLIEVDKLIMFPNDRGIPHIVSGKAPRVFINEERIFGIVKVKDKK
jgi:hypothetical protein